MKRSYRFRWIQWNLDKAELHGCTPVEAEWVVSNPARGYPRRDGQKYLARGRGQGNRWVQVVYLIDPDGKIFVIHAIPLVSRRRKGGR